MTKRMRMIASIVIGDTLKGVFLIFEVPHVTVLCTVVHIQSENSHMHKTAKFTLHRRSIRGDVDKEFVEATSGLYTMKSNSKEN